VQKPFLASYLAALVLVSLSAAQAAPARPLSVAEDVADISSRACYGLTSGTIALPVASSPQTLDAVMSMIRGFGLTFGIDQAAMAGLGPAGQAMISRATMGSKANGDARIILAVGGAIPGCRVILVANPDPALTEAVAGALLAQPGWRAMPRLTQSRDGVERRIFLRRDATGKPYLLNLMTVTNPASKLRLFTSIAAIPPGVALPEGF
jgi:hypothetical protein